MKVKVIEELDDQFFNQFVHYFVLYDLIAFLYFVWKF